MTKKHKYAIDRVQEIRTKRAGNRETGRRNNNYISQIWSGC